MEISLNIKNKYDKNIININIYKTIDIFCIKYIQ